MGRDMIDSDKIHESDFFGYISKKQKQTTNNTCRWLTETN